MNRTYVFFANGFEEMEAIGTVDILRRAGMDAVSVSINETNTVTGAHGVTVLTDTTINDINADDAEWLVLPGGMPGATNLYVCSKLRNILLAHYKKNAPMAAICASPAVVLGQLGLLQGRTATCYPGFEEICSGAEMQDKRAVADGNLVTANGPSSVANMCFEIIKIAKGHDVAVKVMGDMLIYPKETDYYY